MFIQPEQLPGAVLLQNLVLKTRQLRSRPSLSETDRLGTHIDRLIVKIPLQNKIWQRFEEINENLIVCKLIFIILQKSKRELRLCEF